MSKSLSNTETGITIGYMLFKNKYVLYVQKGQTRRLFATFRAKSVADEFIEVMKEFDKGGGNDGDL